MDRIKILTRVIKNVTFGIGLAIMATPINSFANGNLGSNVSTTSVLKTILMIIGGVIAIIGIVMAVPATFKYIMAHKESNGTAQSDASKDLAVGLALIGFGAALAVGTSPLLSALGI